MHLLTRAYSATTAQLRTKRFVSDYLKRRAAAKERLAEERKKVEAVAAAALEKLTTSKSSE